MTELKAPYTVLTEARASVGLDHDKSMQTQYDPEGLQVDDKALAEIDRLKQKIAALEQLIASLQEMIHSAAGNLTAADAKIRAWKEAQK